MKLSEVTIDELKQYANVYTADDDNLFDVILSASKSFISIYTGIPLSRFTNAPVVNPIQPGSAIITGTSISGYTITVTFADNTTATALVQSDGTWSVNVPITETLNDGDKVNVTQTSPSGNISSPTISTVGSTAISPQCLDDFEDVSIALMVLSNEMYDNRSMTVDNDKLNFVVKQILDSHSVNLL